MSTTIQLVYLQTKGLSKTLQGEELTLQTVRSFVLNRIEINDRPKFANK